MTPSDGIITHGIPRASQCRARRPHQRRRVPQREAGCSGHRLAARPGEEVLPHTAVVHDPPPPTPALETTTGALAPVPDVCRSTTKAREGLGAIHDAPTVCSAVARVTRSTDCLNQVVPTAVVNEARE